MDDLTPDKISDDVDDAKSKESDKNDENVEQNDKHVVDVVHDKKMKLNVDENVIAYQQAVYGNDLTEEIDA